MKINVSLTQVEAGIVTALLGVTAGTGLQNLFDHLKANLDDLGYEVYEKAVAEAYDCLERDFCEDKIIKEVLCELSN